MCVWFEWLLYSFAFGLSFVCVCKVSVISITLLSYKPQFPSSLQFSYLLLHYEMSSWLMSVSRCDTAVNPDTSLRASLERTCSRNSLMLAVAVWCGLYSSCYIYSTVNTEWLYTSCKPLQFKQCQKSGMRRMLLISTLEQHGCFVPQTENADNSCWLKKIRTLATFNLWKRTCVFLRVWYNVDDN